MKKPFPGFTVLIERALRLTCVFSVVALAAACGGGDLEDEGADDANTPSVQGNYSAVRPGTTDARRGGIVLSEKASRPRSGAGIVLSEKARSGIVLSEVQAAPSGWGMQQ